MPELDPAAHVRPVILMPTYNEVENLELIVAAVRAAQPSFELCILDDGSPDGTGDVADRLAAADANVHVVHRPNKEGLGRAYLHGFEWALQAPANYTHVFEMDADFSHDPAYLGPLLRACEAGADIALGSRYVDGGGIEGWGAHRLALSRGGSLYARTVLGVSVRDLTGGFKCFRRAVLEALPLDEVMTVGYGFQIEVTYRALAMGFSVEEVPIVFPDRQRGQSKMSMRIFWEGVTSVWKLRLGGGRKRR